MAKTYPDIGTFSPGDILTAATMNEVGTNLDNQRVPAMCRARRAAAQSINNNAQHLINWDTEDYDTDTMFTASNTLITIKTAGVYLVTATVAFVANFTDARGAQIVINPTTSGSGDSTLVTAGTRIAIAFYDRSPSTQSAASISTAYNFAVNDTIGVIAYQNSGGALNTFTTDPPSVSVTWLGQVS